MGINIHDHTAKNLNQFLGKMTIHYAIFVCSKAEDNCPFLYSHALNKIAWPFEDPASAQGTENEQLEKFRETRTLIKDKIQEWLDSQ